jgi:hypothetical protein
MIEALAKFLMTAIAALIGFAWLALLMATIIHRRRIMRKRGGGFN